MTLYLFLCLNFWTIPHFDILTFTFCIVVYLMELWVISFFFFFPSDKAKFKNLVFMRLQLRRKNPSLPVTVVTHMTKRKLNCLLTCLLWFESGLPSLGLLPNTQLPQTIFCGRWPHWNLRAKAKKNAIIIANKP